MTCTATVRPRRPRTLGSIRSALPRSAAGALAALAATCSIAACGDSSSEPPEPFGRVATTAETATATTPAKPPAAKREQPRAAKTSTAAAAPKPPTGAEDPRGPNPPLTCLRKAGLTQAAKRALGTWAATTRDGDEILVDGPYKSAAKARASASSLKGVTRAEPAGIYVVSAVLRADVGAEVSSVARCLRDRT